MTGQGSPFLAAALRAEVAGLAIPVLRGALMDPVPPSVSA